MSTDKQQQQEPAAGNPVWLSVLGWILTLLVGGAMIASGVVKVMKVPIEGAPDIGFNENTAVGLGYIEIGAGVLYLFPPTSVIGAIVLTGYLGGAVLTHIRLADWFLIHFVIGTLMWTGLVWRNERLRSVTPWGRGPDEPAGGFLAALGKIFIVLLVVAGTIAALAVAQPEGVRIQRSMKIAAPASDIFPHVNDFEKWKPWTPFLDADPTTTVKIDGTPGKGATYKWESTNNNVGEGSMTIIESVPNERIRFKLEFVRPMQDTAEAEFTFKQEGNETVVTWAYIGKREEYAKKLIGSVVPMDLIIGKMFETGLTRLKDVAKDKK